MFLVRNYIFVYCELPSLHIYHGMNLQAFTWLCKIYIPRICDTSYILKTLGLRGKFPKMLGLAWMQTWVLIIWLNNWLSSLVTLFGVKLMINSMWRSSVLPLNEKMTTMAIDSLRCFTLQLCTQNITFGYHWNVISCNWLAWLTFRCRLTEMCSANAISKIKWIMKLMH